MMPSDLRHPGDVVLVGTVQWQADLELRVTLARLDRAGLRAEIRIHRSDDGGRSWKATRHGFSLPRTRLRHLSAVLDEAATIAGRARNAEDRRLPQ